MQTKFCVNSEGYFFSPLQIITINEAKRRQSISSCDGDLCADVLPTLSDTSDLLQDTHIEKVNIKHAYMQQSCKSLKLRSATSHAGRSALLYDGFFFLQLACRLPARVQGYPWRLAYSTVKHGTSLKTLYRNLADVDSPVLLVIKDMEDQVHITSQVSCSQITSR